MAEAWSHRTFRESLGVAACISEEEGREDKVTDLRELNKLKFKDSYPLTYIHEILHSLQGATVFSSPNACGAYHAMRIEPGSQVCTAFISPLGTFQYIRMPFGLANAGSVYSRMLDLAMKEVDRDFWTSYLDNVLTYSGEPWAHFGHLTQVELSHVAVEIKIQHCKTKLFQLFQLGHKISKGGVFMNPEYLQKIKDWPVGTQKGDGSGFVLGIRRILQNLHTPVFSTEEQLDGIKKAEKSTCNERIEQYFIELKKTFTEGGIKAFPYLKS